MYNGPLLDENFLISKLLRMNHNRWITLDGKNQTRYKSDDNVGFVQKKNIFSNNEIKLSSLFRGSYRLFATVSVN